MISKIKKRNGDIVDFDKNKITIAIEKAFSSLNKKYDLIERVLTDEIIKKIELRYKDKIVDVETIQDLVEKQLMEEKFLEVAKAYIIYRYKHKENREIKKMVDETFKIAEDYLNLENWEINENANMDFSLQGLNSHIHTDFFKKFWLDKIYNEKIKTAHNKGDLHIHDLGMLSTYCCGWDLYDLLKKGFSGVKRKMESKPPKHFNTALNQIVNFIYTLQGESAGAQALSSFDTLLAPFIKFDNLTYKEVKQFMQSFIFNMNVPTRVGFQTPFFNITMDLQCPKTLEHQPVVIGGKTLCYVIDKELDSIEEIILLDNPYEYKPEFEYLGIEIKTYKDFQNEMDMINRAFCEVMKEGDKNNRIFSFPIPTYNITKEFDWENENNTYLWEMTAKYGIPYFANYINSDLSPEDATSMCPVSGEHRVLIKNKNKTFSMIPIKILKQNEIYNVYSNGKFIKCKLNRYNNLDMFNVELINHEKIIISKEHLNYIKKKQNSKIEILQTKDIKEGYYLPYSIKEYKNIGLNYDLGYLVGCYAGDGSLNGEWAVIFSLSDSKTKLKVLKKLIRIIKKYFGADYRIRKKKRLITLIVNSQAVYGLCKQFVENKKIYKKYKTNIFSSNTDFRKGLIQGHIDTDGNGKNRIYSSSIQMVEMIKCLLSTLGTTCSVMEDNRTGRYSDNTVYCMTVYRLKREKYGDIFFIEDGFLWLKINKIYYNDRVKIGYCFEVLDNKEPMFNLSNGIITHNCRLRLDNRKLKKRGGGLFGANPQTGSIGVVTINMARLGYLSKDKEDFYLRLNELLEIAKESLETKRKVIENLTEKGLYPYSRFYLQEIKDRFGKYWINHFSTIGLVGMNECCLNFLEKDITTKEGYNFTLEVLDYMRDKIFKYQEETKNQYNLEATPAESTAYRLALKDKKEFEDIITQGQDHPYYTNSSQLPAMYTTDLFEALEHQNEIQIKYTGGTVLHGFLGESITDSSIIPKLIKNIFTKYEIPYFSITPTFSICPVHGYIKGEHNECNYVE